MSAGFGWRSFFKADEFRIRDSLHGDVRFTDQAPIFVFFNGPTKFLGLIEVDPLSNPLDSPRRGRSRAQNRPLCTR